MPTIFFDKYLTYNWQSNLMICDEIFEHGVSMQKTVWKKKGDDISRQKVKRVIATDVRPRPRSNIEIKDNSK